MPGLVTRLPNGNAETIALGSYLLERLVQLGVKPIFGVPGDFNLAFLDLVEDHPYIEWAATCNELNAAYAADGYARTKQAQAGKGPGVHGLGAILTTYGVGELSALNGIAGAFAENVPILHIVGAPSTKMQEQGALLHHTLGDGKFDPFLMAAKPFSAAQAFLTSTDGAGAAIDSLLETALGTSKPVYLTLPANLVMCEIPASPLRTALRAQQPVYRQPFSPAGRQSLERAAHSIKALWTSARRPVFLVDVYIGRHGLQEPLRDLLATTGATYFTTPYGKGVLPETPGSGFGGIYAGGITDPPVKAAFESADLVILCAPLRTDFNTGGFSWVMKSEQMIELHPDHCVVGGTHHDGVGLLDMLNVLQATLPSAVNNAPTYVPRLLPNDDKSAMVTQEAFWPLWSSFLRENDIVLAEAGTSGFGALDLALPSGATVSTQILYGSIGWACGATLGCLEAAQESRAPRRTILFTGDGALQLSVQEVATMVRRGLKPIIVILNNDGYVVERVIHGETRVYNDISRWNWQLMLPFFNAEQLPMRNWEARSRGELEDILASSEFAAADTIQVLEVHLGRLDAPRALKMQAKLCAQLNSA